MAKDVFTHHCRQEAETTELAKLLGQSLLQLYQAHPRAHLNLSLEGDLGAGKTTFARHLIQGLGYVGKVRSPTYALCEQYPLQIDSAQGLQMTAYHFDLYRMRDPLEWQDAGFAEHFDEPGFCVIEWPEKAEGTLPALDLRILMNGVDDERAREITMQAQSPQGQIVLTNLISNMQ